MTVTFLELPITETEAYKGVPCFKLHTFFKSLAKNGIFAFRVWIYVIAKVTKEIFRWYFSDN